jgi:dihydroxy-acid dehydratase
MPCESRESCAGCPCNGSPNTEPINIEDCQAELFALRRRAQDLEGKLSALKDGKAAEASQTATAEKKLRSSRWFGNEVDPGISSIYIERYRNYGMTRDELTSGKPIIGIAQTGSDLAPCNRYHIELAKRVRDGIRSAGGIAFEFPMHPIQESSRRPTATLDRNLAYLSLVEVLYAYPLDGVVLLTGCDKTTPACLMAAATMVSRLARVSIRVSRVAKAYIFRIYPQYVSTLGP